jgi:hypothetical protein
VVFFYSLLGVFILRRDELAMLAKANEEQAAIGILPRRLRR